MKAVLTVAICLVALSCSMDVVGQSITAQDYYVLGDIAYKKGDLPTAIRSWTHAVRMRPANPVARKRLAQARQDLYNIYKDFAKNHNIAGDPVTAYVELSEVIKVLPDKLDLVAQREMIAGRMTSDELIGLDAYYRAVARLNTRDFSGASTAINEARTHAGSARCVQAAARIIDRVMMSGKVDRKPEAMAKPAEAAKPIVVIFFASNWCSSPCESMVELSKQIESEYAGKVQVTEVDIDASPDLAKLYGIGTVPAQVFLGPDKKVVFTHIGTLPVEELRVQLERMGVK